MINEELLNVVNRLLIDGPKRATELIVELHPKIHDHHGLSSNIVEFINDLVKAGEIVEVEYELPSMPYRTKSLYFPKGATIRIPEGEDHESAHRAGGSAANGT